MSGLIYDDSKQNDKVSHGVSSIRKSTGTEQPKDFEDLGTLNQDTDKTIVSFIQENISRPLTDSIVVMNKPSWIPSLNIASSSLSTHTSTNFKPTSTHDQMEKLDEMTSSLDGYSEILKGMDTEFLLNELVSKHMVEREKLRQAVDDKRKLLLHDLQEKSQPSGLSSYAPKSTFKVTAPGSVHIFNPNVPNTPNLLTHSNSPTMPVQFIMDKKKDLEKDDLHVTASKSNTQSEDSQEIIKTLRRRIENLEARLELAEDRVYTLEIGFLDMADTAKISNSNMKYEMPNSSTFNTTEGDNTSNDENGQQDVVEIRTEASSSNNKIFVQELSKLTLKQLSRNFPSESSQDDSLGNSEATKEASTAVEIIRPESVTEDNLSPMEMSDADESVSSNRSSDGPEMTYNEKNKLRDEISVLSTPELLQLVKLIQSKENLWENSLASSANEEIILDFEKLKRGTLIAMREFVSNCKNEPAFKKLRNRNVFASVCTGTLSPKIKKITRKSLGKKLSTSSKLASYPMATTETPYPPSSHNSLDENEREKLKLNLLKNSPVKSADKTYKCFWPTNCIYQSKGMKGPSKIKRHYKKHVKDDLLRKKIGDLPFCDICKKEYRNRKSYRDHVSKHHAK